MAHLVILHQFAVHMERALIRIHVLAFLIFMVLIVKLKFVIELCQIIPQYVAHMAPALLQKHADVMRIIMEIIVK